jgi:hypothetical protein
MIEISKEIRQAIDDNEPIEQLEVLAEIVMLQNQFHKRYD